MINLISVLLAFVAMATSIGADAKDNLHELQPAKGSPVEAVKLASDARSSTFLIFIREGVPNHIHESHSESIYVIAGSGLMRVGTESVALVPGDFIHVPMGTVHGVKVTSEMPLKVLSIQAPEFHGADRIWVED